MIRRENSSGLVTEAIDRIRISCFSARLTGPHRVVAGDELVGRDGHADIGVVVEHHAFLLHLRDALVDVVLLHLEVGHAVAQQAAGLRPSLIEMDVVAGTRELLRTSKSCGA